MRSTMQNPAAEAGERLFFWQHETHPAARKGNGKIVTDNDLADNIEWELHDLANGFSETNNLVHQHSDIVRNLSNEWHKFASRVDATPFPENRTEPEVSDKR